MFALMKRRRETAPAKSVTKMLDGCYVCVVRDSRGWRIDVCFQYWTVASFGVTESTATAIMKRYEDHSAGER